jgi:hypothetical protein
VNPSMSAAAFQEIATSLTPTAVSRYLAATSPWQLEARREHSEVWALSGKDGKLQGRIMLPLATDYADFRERFSETLTALGRINGWSPGEVEQCITASRAEESGETPS